MHNLIRTSITIPEDVYDNARLVAARRRESVSKLISKLLETHLVDTIPPKKQRDPQDILGKYSLGAKEPYKHRSEIYDEYLERKMGRKMGR